MPVTKKVKDLTADELKSLIRETVTEAIDPEALKESMEILADRQLMAQIKSSVKAYREGEKEKFVSLKKVKSRHAS